MARDDIYRSIDAERVRQDLKWGVEGSTNWRSGDFGKVTVLTEEVGEVARASLKENRGELEQELIQVAAVAVKWLEFLAMSDASSPVLHTEDFDQLKNLSYQWDTCTLCTLCENKGPGPLFDHNCNPKEFSGLVFVGEGPGAKEKESGLPFCGPAGQVLNSVLARLGLSREQVYVTNIVKHRAETPEGKDRAPTEVERDVCFTKWFTREMQLVQPKAIVALGATAASALGLDASSMSNLVGKAFTVDDLPSTLVTAIAHPAWPLHNPKEKPTYLKQVEALESLLVEKGILHLD